MELYAAIGDGPSILIEKGFQLPFIDRCSRQGYICLLEKLTLKKEEKDITVVFILPAGSDCKLGMHYPNSQIMWSVVDQYSITNMFHFL